MFDNFVCVLMIIILIKKMEIFDAYVEDLAAQEKAKEKKSTKAGAGKEEGKQKKVNAMDLQVRMYICTTQ